MPFSPASSGSVAAFCGIVAFVILGFLVAVHHAYGPDAALARRATARAALGLLLWLGAMSGLVASGQMPALPLQGAPFFFGGTLVVSAAAGLSPFGRRLALALPLAALVGFQAFRLPLELVLHRWAELGTIPTTMTWTGQNWDILSGAVALVAAPFAGRSRAVAWLANLIGAALLVNVMRVALFSAPVPFGWNVQPPLLLAFHLPYALIGPVCVGGALAGHVILTRKLLTRPD